MTAPLRLADPGVAPIVEQLKRRNRYKVFERARGLMVRNFTSEKLCVELADLIAIARREGFTVPAETEATK